MPHSQSRLFPIAVAVAVSVMAGHPAAAQTVSVDQFISNVEGTMNAFTANLPTPNPPKPIIFSGQEVFAYGASIANVPLDALLQYADGLKASGVQRIDFNLGVTSLSNPLAMANYDALVRHIRQLGLYLAINPDFQNGEITVNTFQDFQNVAIKTYPQIVARYHPDNFVIVHEPTTQAARMGITTTPADWDAFIRAVEPLIKAASPHTRVGAGDCSHCNEETYFADFASIPTCNSSTLATGCLDFLTMDIYTDTELSLDTSWAETAHTSGKGVYIEETFAPKYLSGTPQDFQSNPGGAEVYTIIGSANAVFEDLDQLWLADMAKFAQAYGMEAITPFTTQTFFLYVTCSGTTCPDKTTGNSGYSPLVLPALAQGDLTATAKAYLADSQQFGVKTVTTLNNASYATLPSAFNPNCGGGNPCNPDSTVAPDMLASAFGTNLATETATDSTFPTKLGGTTATLVDSSNTSIPVHLYSVSQYQVNYLVPGNAQFGPATITVTSGDGTVTSGVVLVAPVAPGLYTASSNGQGTAAAIAVCAGTCSGWPNKLGNGQFWQYTFTPGCSEGSCALTLSWGSGDSVAIELYGTGFRHRAADAAVTATINGQTVPVGFSGAQGSDTGLDQVNVSIPQSLAGSGSVNLVVSVQDTVNNVTVASNTVSLYLK